MIEMGEPEMAETLRRLLGLYEGVRVARVRCGRPPAYPLSAIFQVAEPTLVNRFASFAENANVAFLVWSNGQVKGSEGETPWYEWRVNPDSARSYTPRQLCAYMVSDLTKRGVLDQLEGDRLLADLDTDA